MADLRNPQAHCWRLYRGKPGVWVLGHHANPPPDDIGNCLCLIYLEPRTPLSHRPIDGVGAFPEIGSPGYAQQGGWRLDVNDNKLTPVDAESATDIPKVVLMDMWRLKAGMVTHQQLAATPGWSREKEHVG